MDRRETFLLLGGLFVSACTAGEDFVKPTIDLPSKYPLQAGGGARRNDQKWWLAFNDRLLNELIVVGLKQNLDIRRALERIEYSRALSGAAGYPFGGSARIGESKISGGVDADTVTSSFVRTEAYWTADLFGEFKRAKEAAQFNLDAAYDDADIARLLLINDIAGAYIDMRYYQQLIRVNTEVLEIRKKTVAVALEMQAKGEVSDLEVAQARSIVATAEASLPESKIFFARSVSRMVALVGETQIERRRAFDYAAPQPSFNDRVIKSGVPADLVRYNPEIRRAEMRFAEAVALAGVAEADIYPSLQLTGNINVNVVSSDFVPPAGFLRLGLDVPLFDLPKRKARLQAQLARSRELRLIWEKEVVLAVEEVTNALVALEYHRQAVKAAGEAVTELNDVLRLAREAFAAGKVSFFQILDAERSVLNAENALALDRRNLATDFIKLNVALGGSFDAS